MPQYFSYKSTNAISKLALSISYENIERCVCAGSNFFKDIKKSASDIFALSLRLRRKDIRSFLLNILSKVTAARTPRSILVSTTKFDVHSAMAEHQLSKFTTTAPPKRP